MQFTERELDEMQLQAEIFAEEVYAEFEEFFLGGRAEPAMDNPPEQQGVMNG